MINYKTHTHCRACGSADLKMYLDLGLMPLANNLEATETLARKSECYPLQVLFCQDCSLSQLSIVIDPEVLFSNYVYRSSINKGYVDHCRRMARDLKEKHGLTKGSFMIDIAGNDGALLKEFRDEIGLRVLNIDPAVNLSAINDALGIRVLTEFWGTKCAGRLNGMGKADLITATNVFAHVDNVIDFLQGAEMALADNGVLVMEFPYLIDFIEKNEFDTVYFEHLSYFSIIPLAELSLKSGLYITSVEHFDIHGGTVRVTLKRRKNKMRKNNDSSRQSYINNEQINGYTSFAKYTGYANACKKAAKSFELGMFKIEYPERIAAFAASAKGNTLLNYAGNYSKIEYIVDETPEKLGKYTPGNARPIISIADMMRNPPDYLLILSWNFADEIKAKCRAAGYRGKFVIPIPEWEIVD